MSTTGDLGGAMELRHLRYFVAVAEELNFSRAAERLNMAQPPLSVQIQKLEALLGVGLFARTNRRVDLTEAGRQLLPKARETLVVAREAAETARRAERGEQGVVRLAFDMTAGWELVPALLEAAGRRLGGIEVIADELWRLEAALSPASPPFDVGLAFLAGRPPGLRFETLRDEPLVVAVGRDHPLSGARSLPLSALADERFTTYPRAVAPAHHRTVLRVAHGAGFEPHLDEQAVMPPTVWRMLALRRSVMLIPRAAAPFAAAAGAVTLALEPPVPAVPLELFWPHTGPRPSPAVERLVELAREIARAPSDP